MNVFLLCIGEPPAILKGVIASLMNAYALAASLRGT